MNALDPLFPIGKQIEEVLRVHSPQLGRAERKARVLELLRMVEIPEPERRVRSYPHQLSGGQAQRTMIAMALTCEPELLIADVRHQKMSRTAQLDAPGSGP